MFGAPSSRCIVSDPRGILRLLAILSGLAATEPLFAFIDPFGLPITAAGP